LGYHPQHASSGKCEKFVVCVYFCFASSTE